MSALDHFVEGSEEGAADGGRAFQQLAFLRISARRHGRAATCSASAAQTEPAAGPGRRAADAEAVLHWAPRADDALLHIFSKRTILGAFATERLRQRHVPFVAGVRKDAVAVERRERERYRPWPLVRLRIVDRHLVLHDVFRDSLQAFGELQLRAVPVAVAVHADRRLIREVRRLDDELVAFP